MQLQENKQYTTQFSFEFPRDEIKEITCHVFLFDEKIYAVSFVDGKNFVKAAYDKDTKELLFFENYANNVISFSGITINEFTSTLSSALKENIKIEELNHNLIDVFELIVQPFSIERNILRFSLELEKDYNLSKHVEFISDYGYAVSDRGYLHLRVLKGEDTLIYSIEDYKFKPICKFVFNVEDRPNGDILHLIRRTNYVTEAKIFDFNILNKNFSKLNSTSERMHADKSDGKIDFSDALRYSIFYILYGIKNTKPLPLSI